ncbi:hypothetical protein JCM8097_003475 [Rhodosporidiobolus ruineniae]
MPSHSHDNDPDNYSVGETAQGERKTGGLSGLFHRAQERIPALSAVPAQFRQQAARLNPSQLQETLKLQLTIKAGGSVVQDYQALAREHQLFAKTLYEWSKDDEGADVVDIADRLAFLQFKQSELELDAAAKLEQSRSLIKDIRNFENDLVPRRRNATAISTKIATLRKENKKNSEEQINKLSTELSQLEQENSTFESSFRTLKRTKLHEAFSLQFAAQQELGEKSALVARYGQLLLQGMETDGAGSAYSGKERTARVKAELEEALQKWTPAAPAKLQEATGSSFLSRSDTRSFGETHSSQLSQLGSPTPTAQPTFSSTDASTIPAAHGRVVPPLPPHPPALHQQESFVPPLPPREEINSTASLYRPSSHNSGTSGSVDPSLPINLSPTARPPLSDILAASPPREMPIPAPPPGVDPSHPAGIAPPEPTVAETGVAKLGTGGPSSGQLRPRGKSLVAQQQEEEERKKRAEEAQRETFNAAGWGAGGVPGGFGSASSQVGGSASAGGADEALPAYGEGDDEATRARERAEQILAEERERKQVA